MADVEMKEAASGGSSKAKGKTSEGTSDGKKKFEVKKVCTIQIHRFVFCVCRKN